MKNNNKSLVKNNTNFLSEYSSSIQLFSSSSIFLVLIFFLLASMSLACAETTEVTLTVQEQAWIKAHPQVRIGGSPDWTPFNFANADGEYQGIANDYLTLIGNKTGLTFSVSIDEWNKNIQKIRKGEIDILGAVYFTQERSEFLFFSEPYLEVLDYFFVRDDLKVSSFEDLNGKRVAIPKDYAHEKLLKEHFPEIVIVSVDTFGDAIDAVIENRADMLYETYGSITYTLEKEGINTIVPFKSTRHLGKKYIHIASRKNEPELASIINKGLQRITPQEKRAIFNKWLSKDAIDKQQKITFTATEQNWIDSNPIVRYGAEKDWAPYDFINAQGNHDGIAKDYLDKISEQTGLQFEPVVDDWDVLLQNAKSSKIDLLVAIYSSEEREKQLVFSSPYQTMLDYFFVHSDLKVNTLEDLNGKTIAIPRGYRHVETMKREFPKIHTMETDDLRSAVQAVVEGRAGILLDSHPVINFLLKKQAITTIRPFKALTPDKSSKMYMAASPQKAILAKIINKSLAAIPEVDKQQIRDKWLVITPEAQNFSLSKDERKWLDEQQSIRFTGDPNWLPYEAFDNEGNYIGIVADYLSLISKRLGINISIIPSKTWAEATNKIRSKQVDIISETVDSELNSSLAFTQAYLSSPVAIIMRNNENYVENIDQIRRKKIAVIKDYGYVPKIVKQYRYIDFYEVNSIQDGLSAVSTGKTDALLATLAQASYHISELGMNNIRIVGKTEFNTELAFGMRKEFAPLVPLFNRALNDIKQNEKQSILTVWGKQKFAERTNYLLIFQIAGILLSIIIFVVYWNRRLANEVSNRKAAEAQTQALIDSVPLQIVVTSMDGSILTANPQTLSDYDIDKQAISQLKISDFYSKQSDRELVENEIRKKGKISQRIVPFKRTNGEIRSMMISVIPITYSEQTAFLTIAVDMTERIEAEQELNKAKELAESGSRAKSEFLSNMSHEIRTPMNAIIGFTELLKEQVEQPKLLSFVNTIHTAGLSLLTLINDILDLSKVEAGKLKIEKTSCNPYSLFTEIGKIFEMKVREKGIDLIIEVAPEIPKNLQIDATRLRQVLFNLIGNAVKFTEKGYIRIKVYTDNEDNIHSKLDLVIEVKDTGVGISEDQQQVIFQDFEQSSGQDIRKYGGTGLGLSISKKLVGMMGGTISLRSKKDEGSTFIVKLAEVDVSSIELQPDDEDSNSSSQIEFLPCKILLVDDIKNNRDLLLANFADTNVEITEAEDGQQAIDLAQQDFDLILMDIRMPVKDGYQAAKEINAFSKTPIIALTASVMTDDFERVRTDDFVGYLRKPVLKADLVDELKKYLPYRERQLKEKEIASLSLNDKELQNLPLALEGLDELISQYKMCCKNNNISEIKAFVSSLKDITSKYPVMAITDYTVQLDNYVDSFDISAIKGSLKIYPQLISQLKESIDN